MVFESSQGPLYYECHGHESNQPILFLHALGADHFMFKKQVDRFKNDYRIILVDLPWHGESYNPSRLLDFDETVKVLKELINHLGISDLALSGVSLGGYLAQWFAYRHPDLIKAVHMDGAHPLHMPFHPLIRAMSRIHSFLTVLLPKPLIYTMASVALSTDRPSRHVVKTHFKQYSRKQLINLSEGAKQGLMEGIDKPIPHPVLLTIGEKEFGFIRRRCEKWDAQNPSVLLQEIAGGNHLHVTQYPQAYEACLKSFLDSIQEKE